MEKHLGKIKELEEHYAQDQRKRESEEKAEKKYKEWLQKKKQEEIGKKQKEKVILLPVITGKQCI